MSHLFAITLLIGALALALTGCDAPADGKPGRGGGGFTRGPTYVRVQPVVVREIRDEVEAIGTTKANERVTLTTKITDTVSGIHFEDGDFVEAGKVLVELTRQEQTALLAESRANMEDAGKQSDRQEKLAADELVPQSVADEARARYEAQKGRYDSLVARLEDRLIRAPFSGKLGFREVSTGTLVSPGTPITTLDDISIIKLDFSIPEVHLALVAEGLTLVAESSAFPGVSFEATVRTIGSRVDPITRSAVVRAHIDNADARLLPGMLLTVRLTTAVRNALMVPEPAVLQRAAQVFAFTLREGRAELVQIRTGKRSNGWIEILSGLEEGQPVVTEGVIKIRDGSPVTTELGSGPGS